MLLEKVNTPGCTWWSHPSNPQIFDAWKDHANSLNPLAKAPQAYTDLKNLALGVKTAPQDDSDIKPHLLMPWCLAAESAMTATTCQNP